MCYFHVHSHTPAKSNPFDKEQSESQNDCERESGMDLSSGSEKNTRITVTRVPAILLKKVTMRKSMATSVFPRVDPIHLESELMKQHALTSPTRAPAMGSVS